MELRFKHLGRYFAGKTTCETFSRTRLVVSGLLCGIALPGFVILGISGCTPTNLLEPKSLPPEQIRTAIVQTPSPIYRNGKDLIVIKTIDGVLPTFMETKAIVSPGEHTFQIGVELHHESSQRKELGYITKADTSLRFDVEANGEYLIDALEDEHGVWVWITDLNTKFIVAGDPPKALPKADRVEPMWRHDK